MRIETQLKLQEQGKIKINSIIYFTKQGKKTTLSAYQELNKVKKELKDKKAPLWIAQYLQGYFDFQIEEINHKEIEFVYIIDNEVYSTWKETSFKKLESEQYSKIDNDTKHGHVWKGTLKPVSGILNGLYSNNEYKAYEKARKFCEICMKGALTK